MSSTIVARMLSYEMVFRRARMVPSSSRTMWVGSGRDAPEQVVCFLDGAYGGGDVVDSRGQRTFGDVGELPEAEA